MKRPHLAVLPPLISALLIVTSAPRNAAQVVMPPGASLDIQIPAAPMPVSLNGQRHLAYELHVTNFRAVDLALTRIEVLGDRNAAPLASYQERWANGIWWCGC